MSYAGSLEKNGKGLRSNVCQVAGSIYDDHYFLLWKVFGGIVIFLMIIEPVSVKFPSVPVVCADVCEQMIATFTVVWEKFENRNLVQWH